MARIAYGVMGDSRGHVSRSLAVAQHLEGHDVTFVGGGVVLELRDKGHGVVPAPMLETVLRQGRVDAQATLANALRLLARRGRILDELTEALRALRLDLVISDYEYFTPLAARRLGVPCLSLDHQHVLTHCRYAPPAGHRLNRWTTCGIIRGLYGNADRYWISSFHQPPLARPERDAIFPPLLRADALRCVPAQGDYGLVYLRDSGLDWLRTLLRGRPRRFRVYGFGALPPEGNLEFEPPSRSGFLHDLAGCAYVVSNGGHSLASEALHLGKPVLAFPTGFFYEQYVNAHFLEQCGFGMWGRQHQPAVSLDRFEQRLDDFRPAIAGHDFHGNPQVAARLTSLL